MHQARAEGRVTSIHAGLKESEVELASIQKELRDMDQVSERRHSAAALRLLFLTLCCGFVVDGGQLDDDLRHLLHERREVEARELPVVAAGSGDATAVAGTAAGGAAPQSRDAVLADIKKQEEIEKLEVRRARSLYCARCSCFRLSLFLFLSFSLAVSLSPLPLSLSLSLSLSLRAPFLLPCLPLSLSLSLPSPSMTYTPPNPPHPTPPHPTQPQSLSDRHCDRCRLCAVRHSSEAGRSRASEAAAGGGVQQRVRRDQGEEG